MTEPVPSAPKVAIVTCDQEDFAAMGRAAELLNEFDVPYEFVAINPHEAPQRLSEYAEGARDRGLRVILAGTGDAPDLPLVLARQTSLPVIGVPLLCRLLGEQRQSFSLVATHPDVPIATVASGDAKSAALIALRTLALTDGMVAAMLARHHAGT